MCKTDGATVKDDGTTAGGGGVDALAARPLVVIRVDSKLAAAGRVELTAGSATATPAADGVVLVEVTTGPGPAAVVWIDVMRVAAVAVVRGGAATVNPVEKGGYVSATVAVGG